MVKGLHKKYLAAILSVGAVSLFVVLGVVWSIENNAQKEIIGATFKELAEATGENVNNQISNHVEIAKLMADSNAVSKTVMESNEFFNGSLQDVKKMIAGIEQRWTSGKGVNAYLLEIMSNRTTSYLKRNIGSNSDDSDGMHRLLLVANEKGAVVAATLKPEHYSYAETKWWKAAFNDGVGSVYVSDIEYSEKMGGNIFSIAVPVMKNGIAKGVLYMVHNVDGFFKAVTMAQVGQTDHTMIVNDEGRVIFCPVTPASKHAFKPEAMKGVFSNESGWQVTTADMHFPGKEAISGFAPVKISHAFNSSSYGGKKWYVVTSQDPKETFKSVDNLLNSVAMVVLAGLVLVSLLGMFAAGKLLKPIHVLIKGAEQIGDGDLDHRINIKSGDELEDLATKINDMALKLKIFYIKLDEKVRERTVKLEHRNKELDLLYSMTKTINKTIDISIMTQSVPENLVKIFNADHALLWFENDVENKEAGVVDSIGLSPAMLNDKSITGMISLVAKEVRLDSSKIWQSENVTVDYRLEEMGYSLQDYLSLVGIPLMAQDRVIGVIVLLYKQIYALTPWEENVVIPMGKQIGLAFEHAILFNQLNIPRN